MENVRGTQGMTISVADAVKKILIARQQNGRVLMRSSAIHFSKVSINTRPLCDFFNCWSEAFGVTCVPRLEQLVRSTPRLP